MDTFLDATRERLRSSNNTQWVVVSGNEACDLDSVSCALAYAYFKQQQLGTSSTVVPLCNIQRADMPLRTEIVYWLQECGLNWEALFYTDDIFDSETCPLLQSLTDVQLILVDHHSVTGRLKQTEWTVTEIIDHHRLEETSAQKLLLSNCTLKRIEQVGSCASLVCAEMLKSGRAKELPSTLWKLLYGAILVDTVGISELGRDAGRLTDLDLRMACRIEELSGNTWFTEPASRDSLFSGLERAKFTVTGLSVWDLLRRDMKMATGPQMNIACSTVSGMDFTVLLHSTEFVDAAKRMCSMHSTNLLVCITVGSPPSETSPKTFDRRTARKGLVIFSASSQPELCDQLINFLCHDANGLDLRPEPLQSDPVEGVVFTGIVHNIKVTRKAVLPLLISFLKGGKPENPSDSKNDKEMPPTTTNTHSSDPLKYTKPSSTADGLGISWTLLNNLRAWLGTLKPKERFELVRKCLSQVEISEEQRRETELFQPVGILPAPVLQQVTEKLYLLSPFAKCTGVSSRKLTTASDNVGLGGGASKAGKHLNDFGVALNRGRRSTLPISHELRCYHHQVDARKRVTFGQTSHVADDTLSLPDGLPEKPSWLEPEYMSRLPAWFPDHLTGSSADAVEDVSFRLFRRLSEMPSGIKSPNTSIDGVIGILGSEDQLESTTVDPAELELLRASVGELNRSAPVGIHDGAVPSPSHLPQLRSSFAQRGLNWIRSRPQGQQQALQTHQSRTTTTEESVKELPRSSSSTTHTSIDGMKNDCISLSVSHP